MSRAQKKGLAAKARPSFWVYLLKWSMNRLARYFASAVTKTISNSKRPTSLWCWFSTPLLVRCGKRVIRLRGRRLVGRLRLRCVPLGHLL